MFLFKLLKNNGYLPLIEYLHYSMFLFKLSIVMQPMINFIKFIYITVCFYLNWGEKKEDHTQPLFTLQYVSI